MIDSQTFSVRETREQLSRLIELADLTGERFLVTKFGKPKAAIVPVPKDLLTAKNSIRDFIGFMNSDGESGIEYENRARRATKEREYIKRLRKSK